MVLFINATQIYRIPGELSINFKELLYTGNIFFLNKKEESRQLPINIVSDKM